MSDNRVISEGYLLAALPLGGIAIVAINQMGKYMYFGVPLEFLEIDTVKILVSGLSLALYSAAAIASLAMLYNKESIPDGPKRFLHHIIIATFISLPFWIEGVGLKSSISWATVAFITFCAVITASAEHHLKKLSKEGDRLTRLQKIESVSGTFFWVSLLILAAVFAHGANTAAQVEKRLFIDGTNYFVVARAGELLVTKEYFPSDHAFDKERTIVISITDRIVLTERKAILRSER